MSDPVTILEAAYGLSGTEEAWLTALAHAVRPEMNAGGGLVACLYDATRPAWVSIGRSLASGIDDRLAVALFQLGDVPEVELAALVGGFRTLQVGSLLAAANGYPAISKHYEALLASVGVSDLMFVNAMDPSSHGCLLVTPALGQARWTPRAANKWRKLASHISAGLRVRRQLSALERVEGVHVAAEAILTPDGNVEHAAESAKGNAARSALRRAVVALERARGSLRREDPDEALSIWRALVAGRWTLLDHFDSDGRRFVVARRNDPDILDPRGLTQRERQVLAYAALGHSNKLIGYELGLSTSTIGVHLVRARRKLPIDAIAGR